MIARMLLVLLLVMNLGVGAWWVWHRPAPPPAPPPLDASLPVLELMRGPDVAAAAVVPTATNVPEPTAIAAPESAKPETAAIVCASFGPYTDEASAQAARGRIAMPGAQASVRATSGTGARGYNVVMPPLANREAALAMAERLRAAGFNDLIVLGEGEGANGIALGRFGAEEKRATAQIASTVQERPIERAKIVRSGDGSGTLEVQERFDRAWRRVGLALDRVGFTVEDRDRSKGLYYVRYVDPEADAESKKDKDGWLAKLNPFKGSDAAAISKIQYRIYVADNGAVSTIQVLSREGGVDNSEIARRILALHQPELAARLQLWNHEASAKVLASREKLGDLPQPPADAFSQSTQEIAR